MTEQTVSQRVCLAKAEIAAVPKNGYNPHGKYNFASVDDVYHAVRPILAHFDLDLKLDILETDVRASAKGTPWLYLKAAIGFEGEAPQHRFMALPVTGAQTYEIACSYLQKQFLRARLQIETGEYEEQEITKDNPPASGTPAEVDAMLPVEHPDQAMMDSWKEWGTRQSEAIKQADSASEIDHLLADNKDAWLNCEGSAPKIYERLLEIVEDRRAKLAEEALGAG